MANKSLTTGSITRNDDQQLSKQMAQWMIEIRSQGFYGTGKRCLMF